MGIRFLCPNGHKLNVKSELAGKIGVCPKCRAKTTIPLESAFDSGEFRRLKESSGNASSESPENWTTENAPVDSTGDAFAAGASASDERETAASNDDELKRLMREAVDESARGTRRVDVKKTDDDSIDRLIDARNVDWFVRTPDGRSYGPAPSSVLKTWIEEMRVSPSTLVWREGWERWEEAGTIFPEVRRLFSANVDSASERGGTRGDDDSSAAFASLAEAARLSGAARRYADDENRSRRRQKKARRAFGGVVALAALILGLVGVLVYVVFLR